MKIAIFHELDYGGARRAAIELGKKLQTDNAVDFYYADDKEDNVMQSAFSSVKLYPFITKKRLGGNWTSRVYKDTIELLKLYSLHKNIAEDIDNKKYDLILVHPSRYTQAPFLLSLVKTKSIYFCQEPLRMVYDTHVSSIVHLPILNRVYEWCNRLLRKAIDKKNIQHASLILANSEFSKHSIKNAYNLSSVVCYLGVDTKIFKPKPGKKEYDILFIGDKSFFRGYDMLQNSLKNFLVPLKVFIIERREKMQRYTDEELIDIYNKSKIVVALNRNEPFGLIPLEAMACGVPVIAVNEGGYKETIINKETGFLVPRDPKVIAKKINWLLLNTKERKIMGKRSREKVLKKWKWENTINRLEDIFKEFIKN